MPACNGTSQHPVRHREEAEHVAAIGDRGGALHDRRREPLLAKQAGEGESGHAGSHDQNAHISLPSDAAWRATI
jgi:hypothetical protein